MAVKALHGEVGFDNQPLAMTAALGQADWRTSPGATACGRAFFGSPLWIESATSIAKRGGQPVMKWTPLTRGEVLNGCYLSYGGPVNSGENSLACRGVIDPTQGARQLLYVGFRGI